MSREDNVAVFEDTERLCKTNSKLAESIKVSNEQQQLILEGDILPQLDKKIYKESANIVVSKKRSYEAASGYKGQKVCVHNFASATNPGGGVTRGANAQEECLCRCSSLYFCLNTPNMWDEFYIPHRNMRNSIHNDDIIYTPGVTVFKTDTASPKLMPEEDWYEVNVVTCAAPNLRPYPGNAYNSGDGDKAIKITDEELLGLHEKRLRRILDTAVLNKNNVVILGAFGCGAFMNNPEVVARAAKNVISDYMHAFKTIEFAVYCSPWDEQNYRIFDRVLGIVRDTRKTRKDPVE